MNIQDSNFSHIQTFVDLLQHRSKLQPKDLAYIFLSDGMTESHKLTYEDLDKQARAIAAYILLNVKQGTRALMLYPPGLEFVVAFLGCLYAGVIGIPLYPPRSNHHLGRIQAVIDNAEATVVLTTASVLAKIQQKSSQILDNNHLTNLHWITTETIDNQLASQWEKPDINKDTLAFLQYTSGSTGNPKGVMVSHNNLLHNERLIKMAFCHTESTTHVVWLPLFHDMGLIGNVLQSLYLGTPSILMPPVKFLQKPIYWLKAISKYKATTSGGPNFAYDLCVNKISDEQCVDLDLSSWDVAFSGAEPVRAETIEKFSEKFAPYGFQRQAFYPCYGMAETTLFVSGGLKTLPPVILPINEEALQQNQVKVSEDTKTKSTKIVGCGQTFFDKILIVDPQTKTVCREDKVGEIWVAGASVAQGYWHSPDLTQEVFQAYLSDSGEGPFFRTGDLGFLIKGELFITGRLKDLIIIRGRNYYPQDIELTVENSHDALNISSGAAFSIEQDSSEKLVVVQEVKRTYLRKLDSEEVFRSIRRSISENHELQVQSIVLIKPVSIPKTSSGKIQRNLCKKSFLEDTLNVVASWNTPQENPISNQITFSSSQVNSQEIQTWIINWLAQALNLKAQEFDPQRPFADYGIDSVMAVELTQKLSDWLGEEIDMTLVWNFPSIAAVASELTRLNNLKRKEINNQPDHKTENQEKVTDLIELSENRLNQLSEKELAQLLTQEINTIQQRK